VTPPDDAPDYDPGHCHACRGTGQLTSNFGGTPHAVTCPWCEGGGRFIPEHDAQAVRAAAAVSP
jgi:DnaJ-class molecular chaperone